MPQVVIAAVAYVGSALVYAASALSAFLGGTGLLAQIARTVIVFAISSALTSILTPKQKLPERQADVLTLTLGEHDREAVFGETAVAGGLLDAFTYGDKSEWEVLVIALADHECESLVGFYANDTFFPYTADGDHASFFDGSTPCLQIFWRPGTLTQTVPAILTTNGVWTANDVCKGVAYVTVAYRRNDKVFPQGRPRFRFVVKGAKLYDPRKDSTVAGGSGAHRWADPATWEWSANAALVEYNWRRGIWTNGQLIIGPGRSESEAPPADVFAPANLCDEEVPLAGVGAGSVARYTAHGVVKSGEQWIDTALAFALAMGGELLDRAGQMIPEPGAAKTPVFAVTDDDLIEGAASEYQGKLSRAELVNTVTTTYVEPAKLFNTHGAPLRRDAADIIADTEPRELDLPLRFVQVNNQAQRIGELTRRKSRRQKQATILLGPKFIGIEPGDWISWSSAIYFGGDAVTFQVRRVRAAGAGIELSLREIAASCYTWIAGTDELAETSDGFVAGAGLGAATLANFAVEAIELVNGDATVPAIRASWDDPEDSSVVGVSLEWRQVAGADIMRLFHDRAGDGEAIITGGLVSEGEFEVRATPRTVPRREETATAWEPVTLGAFNASTWRDVKFIRAVSQPPTPTGDDPVGWSDGVPDGTAALWQSTATKTATGSLVGVWTTPQLITSLNLRGSYVAATTYQLHDVVTYSGGSYVCINAPTTNPPTGTAQANANWDVLAAPGQDGEPGEPPSEFVATIDLATTSVGVNLRTLAELNGYTGVSDATITFEVESAVTVTGLAGGPNGGMAIDTGIWPGGYTVNLALTVKNGGKVHGGGGKGGKGGDAFSGFAENGFDGGHGGDAVHCRAPITIVVDSGGEIKGGGGGGGGGGGADGIATGIIRQQRGGGGGGGGAPNGPASLGGDGDDFDGDGGAAGTTAGGGNNGNGSQGGSCQAGHGGDGATFGAPGVAGNAANATANEGAGGAFGAAGFAIRKNGHTVPVTNNGTITGTQA